MDACLSASSRISRTLPALIAGGLLVVALAVFTPTASAQVLDPSVTVNVPGVTLDGVEVLGPSTATVSGTVDPNNIPGTEFFVEYQTPDGVLNSTPTQVASGLSLEQVSIALSNLLPGTDYSTRLVAVNPLTGLRSVTDFSQFRTQSVSVDTGTGALTGGGSTGAAGTGAAGTGAAGTGAPGAGARAGQSVAKCTIVGTPKRDVLKGTSRADVICGLGGNDRITGLGGNDVIAGDAGNDKIVGGKGKDKMLGGNGRDVFSARDKVRDRINGGKGRDRGTADRKDRATSVERLRRRR